ncbi:MAG: NfeD family protein [Candidatus Adiutrix sp.]|nr:NfeD family protein [Candidatus Adiutrix sp.]
MEIFGLNAALVWFLSGVFFLVLEALTPGVFLMFFGLGAWVTAAAIFFVPSLGPSPQWLIFSVVSVAALLIFRRKLKALFQGKTAESDNLEDAVVRGQYIGREVTVLKETGPGQPGLAELNGTNWQARSEGPTLAAGVRARVVRLDGLTLIVEPLN